MAEPKDVEQEKVLLTWTAKSRPYAPNQEKTRSVLMVLGILVALVLMFAGEWILICVLAAGAFYYYAQYQTVPEDVEYKITTKGINAFGRLFLWWELQRWWIEKKITASVLMVELSSGIAGRLYIPIEGVQQKEIETLLGKYLLQEKPTETTVERMTKWVAEKFPLENKI